MPLKARRPTPISFQLGTQRPDYWDQGRCALRRNCTYLAPHSKASQLPRTTFGRGPQHLAHHSACRSHRAQCRRAFQRHHLRGASCFMIVTVLQIYIAFDTSAFATRHVFSCFFYRSVSTYRLEYTTKVLPSSPSLRKGTVTSQSQFMKGHTSAGKQVVGASTYPFDGCSSYTADFVTPPHSSLAMVRKVIVLHVAGLCAWIYSVLCTMVNFRSS